MNFTEIHVEPTADHRAQAVDNFRQSNDGDRPDIKELISFYKEPQSIKWYEISRQKR